MSVNTAIFYHSDAFDTSGIRLMGRQAAGEGFLKAFIRHGDVEPLHCYAPDQASFRNFEQRVGALADGHPNSNWIPFGAAARLSEVGTLYRGDPGIADMAWRRRRAGARAYSLCGITHTTASASVLDAIGQLAIAPIQPWDALICTSTAVKEMVEAVSGHWCDYLESRIGARPDMPVQLPVIPLGVDCDAYAPSLRTERIGAELRRRLRIAENDIAVLFFGRISFHAKAHPLPMYLGLQAAAERTSRPIHLILAGWFANDSIRDEFQAAARTYCPNVNVTHVDGRDPVMRANIWFAADLFTSLSDNIQETFGLVPIEAMAAGLPVVVTDWDGYRDTVRQGIDGFLVPTHMPAPGLGADLAWRYLTEIDSYDRYIGHVSQTTSVDVAATADAYTALISQPELRRQMGEAGRARAREVFDWSHVIRAYQSLWTELAERRQSDTEIAQRPEAAPEHPLRADPYEIFQGYPTFGFGLSDEVELAPGAGADDLPRLRRHSMNSFGEPILANTGDCEALLHHLQTRGRCSVESLITGFPPNKRLGLHRAIGWLGKIGLIRFVPRGE